MTKPYRGKTVRYKQEFYRRNANDLKAYENMFNINS